MNFPGIPRLDDLLDELAFTEDDRRSLHECRAKDDDSLLHCFAHDTVSAAKDVDFAEKRLSAALADLEVKKNALRYYLAEGSLFAMLTDHARTGDESSKVDQAVRDVKAARESFVFQARAFRKASDEHRARLQQPDCQEYDRGNASLINETTEIMAQYAQELADAKTSRVTNSRGGLFRENLPVLATRTVRAWENAGLIKVFTLADRDGEKAPGEPEWFQFTDRATILLDRVGVELPAWMLAD